MGILAIEDALLEECKAVLGSRVRTVDSLPGDWDDAMLTRLASFVPAVYVAFNGGERQASQGQLEARIDGRWSLIVVTGHASGQAARRRGDAVQAGAYELLAVLVPRLHGFTVPNEGTLTFVNIVNLYSGSVDSQGLAVYVATFSVPMTLGNPLDESTLDDFEVFAPRLDVPPRTPQLHAAWLAGNYSGGTPDALDELQVRQP